MTQKRSQWIDIAKGIGVILVIMGHMPTIPETIRLWIYSFHMPLFFYLSGYLHKKKDYALQYVCKIKIKKLLIPYILYSMIFISLDSVFFHYDINIVLRRIYRMLIGQGGYDILWFFIALLIVEIIYLTLEANNKEKLLVFVVGIGLLLSYLRLGMIFKLSAAMVSVFFYYIGVKQNNRKEELNIRQVILLAAINIIFTGICIKFSGVVIDINTSRFSIIPISLIAALAGIEVTCYVAKRLQYLGFMRLLAYIGKYSLFFFPLTAYVPNFLDAVLNSNGVSTTFVIKCLNKVIGFIVSYMVVEIYKSIKRKTTIRKTA